MNRQAVLFHLREAAEELNRTVEQLARDRRFGEEALEVAMGHLYHHLNTAWNGRSQTDKQFRDSTDGDFTRFRRFPNEAEFAYLHVTRESEQVVAPNRRPAHRRRVRARRRGGGR